MEFNSTNDSDEFCFVYWQNNSQELKLKFNYPPNKSYAVLEFDETYQGWKHCAWTHNYYA